MVTKNYNNIRYATNLKKKNEKFLSRVRCCNFVAFENFYFHLLVRSSVANPRKKLLTHGRWCPLASIPLRMGLNPSRRSLLLLLFVRHRDTTRHRINTV